MIYFIQAGESGPIKIGYTKGSIEKRIAQMQTGCHEELKCRYKMDGDRETEKNIHKYIEPFRVRGEWFGTPDIIIQTLKMDWNTKEVIMINTGIGIYISEQDSDNLSIYLSNDINIDINISEKTIHIDNRDESESIYKVSAKFGDE